VRGVLIALARLSRLAQRGFSRRSFGAALLCAAPVIARAEAAAPPDWGARFRATSEALHAGEWKLAEQTIDALLAEMRETIASGEGAAPSLAAASLYRAVAEAGLGDREAASWDLWAALALHSALAEADLSGFGEAGRALDVERGAADPPVGAAPAGPTRVTRPEKLRGEVPEFPFGKAQVCRAQAVKVRALIGEDGMPRRPRVDSGTDPVLAYAAMAALRSWRFRPATRDGRPIQVRYTLTIDYRVLNCPAAATNSAPPPDGP
jgi:hypothetical protein